MFIKVRVTVKINAVRNVEHDVGMLLKIFIKAAVVN